METVRLQTINDDTVLEVTQLVPEKIRYSENDLLRKKEYCETMIAKCQALLDEVNARLAEIQNERNKLQ